MTVEKIVEIVEMARAFVVLPHTALPSAILDTPRFEGDEVFSAWMAVRAMARGDMHTARIEAGDRAVLLRADREGWREGVRLRVPR